MLELALRSTLILAAAWLLARTLTRAAAATRHLVWHTAFIAIVAAPCIAPLTPSFAIPGIATLTRSFAIPAAPVQGVQEVQEVQGVQGVQEVQPHAAPSAPLARLARLAPLAPLAELLVTGGMVGGVVVVSVWFAAGWMIASYCVRRASPAPLQWQLELNALREKLRITREVRLGIMRDSGSPLATGLWRATILLPRSSASWSADRRRAVLLHELAHIRRGDCRVQLLTHVACALYWFNPLTWIGAAHLRSERERACDDEVLRSGALASTYATHLLDIAKELRPTLRPSAALAMARAAELEGRVLAVLADRARTPSRGGRWAVALVLTLTTMAALGARPATGSLMTPADSTMSAHRFYVGQDVATNDDRTGTARLRAEAKAALRASPNAEERQRAVMDLAEAGQSDSIQPLQEALKDGSQDVREKAALALAFISGREVVPALLTALRDRDSQVREKAAIGLALRRDERVVEALLAAMQDPDSQVREKVAIALGTSGDARARAALNEALRDPDAQVREKAAAGLVLLNLSR